MSLDRGEFSLTSFTVRLHPWMFITNICFTKIFNKNNTGSLCEKVYSTVKQACHCSIYSSENLQ